MVLSALDKLAELPEEENLQGLEALRVAVGGTAPGDINDDREKAPSKRLLRLIRGPQKTVHGPLALEPIGLIALRQQCPRFCAWIAPLEVLNTQLPKPC